MTRHTLRSSHDHNNHITKNIFKKYHIVFLYEPLKVVLFSVLSVIIDAFVTLTKALIDLNLRSQHVLLCVPVGLSDPHTECLDLFTDTLYIGINVHICGLLCHAVVYNVLCMCMYALIAHNY